MKNEQQNLPTEVERKIQDQIQKLQFEAAKAGISLDVFSCKEEIKADIALKKALTLLQAREETKILAGMYRYKIWQGTGGRLLVGLLDKDDRHKADRIVIEEEFIEAKVYVSSYPKKIAVMKLQFRRGITEIKIFFELRPQDDFEKTLFKHLTKAGIQVIATRRTSKDIRQAIACFFMSEAVVEEIPYKQGYNLNNDGKWEFVTSKKNMRRLLDGIRSDCDCSIN